MPVVNRTEVTRSPGSLVSSTRCYAYDEFGHEYYADVPHSVCVGVHQADVVAAVMSTMSSLVAAGRVGLGQVYTLAQVTSFARSVGSRV